MTQSNSGVMVRLSYRDNPRTNPTGRFDVVRFFAGHDNEAIRNNIKYHVQKTGALGVEALTPQQYQELLDEETKSTKTSTAAKETHQTQPIA
jgi:hypothetical protein